MRIREHLIISFVASLIFSLVFVQGIEKVFLYILVGTLSGVLIDLDHILIVLIIDRRNLKIIKRLMFKPNALIREYEYGRLNYIEPEARVLHLSFSILSFLVLARILPSFYLIIGISILIHIISDVVCYLYYYFKLNK